MPFVGLAIGVTALVLLVDVQGALVALVGADARWVAGAVGLALNATLLVGVKLWCVVRIVGLRRGFRETWSAVMAGVALNAVIPGRGGDLVRAVFLAKEPGSMAVLLGAVLFERLIDVGTIGLLVLLTGVALDWVTGLAIFVVLAAIGGTLTLGLLGPRSPIRPDLGERVARTAGRAVTAWPWTLAAIALSLAAWANNAALMVCALRAVGADIPTFEALRATAVAILAGIVPVSISGIGTRDTVLVLLLESFGQGDQVAAAGLIYTALVYWFLALVGAVALGPTTLRSVSQWIATHRTARENPTD